MLNTQTFGQGPHLSFIHGWGAQNSSWREWITHYLADEFTVTLIELPGAGDSPLLDQTNDIETAWLQALNEVLPERTHLLGWSLGGLLAQKLAMQQPQKIQSLICLASTPRFVQADDWQWAVSPTLMSDFIQAIGKDTFATLSYFWKLQIQGSDGARQLIKKFMAQVQESKLPQLEGLLQGLKLLKQMDCRHTSQQITCPVLWLLGENDPLIPKDFISEFSTIQPAATIEIIQGAAHMPFLSHPQITADLIKRFVLQQAR